MRISDWSSDVCSSDLRAQGGQLGAFRQPPHARQVGAVVAVDEDQAVMLGGRRQQARRAIDGDTGAQRAGGAEADTLQRPPAGILPGLLGRRRQANRSEAREQKGNAVCRERGGRDMFKTVTAGQNKKKKNNSKNRVK